MRFPGGLRRAAAFIVVAALLGACAGGRRAASRSTLDDYTGSGHAPVTPSHATASSSDPIGALRVGNDESGSLTPADSPVPIDMQRLFAPQYHASQSAPDPASSYWALIVGINAYSGSTEDSIGSRPDAASLNSYLRGLGWRSDHIMVLTDAHATAKNIVSGIRWLASKTTDSSTVIFEYAGHEKPASGNPDHDSEKRDVSLWATDNRLVVDGTLGKELNKVRAARMWIDLATCRAAGFQDPGTVKSGRILTFASSESSFAYEDTGLKHTVMGYYLIVKALAGRKADTNGDGKISVQEAFAWSKPYIKSRTHGNQITIMVDKLRKSFFFTIPSPPPPQPSQSPSQPPNSSCLLIC